MPYSLNDDITQAEAEYVEQKLVEFADQFTPPRNYREFGVVLRDEQGDVAGGIVGSIVWDWLQISVLWVSDELRGPGVRAIAIVACRGNRTRTGLQSARLSTFEFEARAFYESHDYVVDSQTDGFPSGHTQYHLNKTL